jgi:hypothetical protein
LSEAEWLRQRRECRADQPNVEDSDYRKRGWIPPLMPHQPMWLYSDEARSAVLQAHGIVGKNGRMFEFMSGSKSRPGPLRMQEWFQERVGYLTKMKDALDVSHRQPLAEWLKMCDAAGFELNPSVDVSQFVGQPYPHGGYGEPGTKNATSPSAQPGSMSMGDFNCLWIHIMVNGLAKAKPCLGLYPPFPGMVPDQQKECDRSGCTNMTRKRCLCNEVYCSPACQRADWSNHREHCEMIMDNSRLGLLLTQLEFSDRGQAALRRLHAARSNAARSNAPPASSRRCAVCAKAALKECSRCKSVRYCGRACQKRHWKAGHKKECVAKPSLQGKAKK